MKTSHYELVFLDKQGGNTNLSGILARRWLRQVGEDSLALRLVSKLPELRAAKSNPSLAEGKALGRRQIRSQSKKDAVWRPLL